MNLGIAAANGNYLLFFGQDDKLFCNKTIEKIKKSININPNKSVWYGNVCIDNSKIFYSEKKDLWLRNRIHHQGMIYSYDCFKKYGLFDDRLHISGDYEHTLRCLQKKAAFKKLNFTVASTSSGGRSSIPSHRSLVEVVKIRNSYYPNAMGQYRDWETDRKSVV